MAATLSGLLAVATAELGYEESGGPSGHDGNVTKFWAELAPSFQGQPWCAAFVSWCFRHAGQPLPIIDQPWGFSYCPDAEAWARAHGAFFFTTPQAGDIALYAFGHPEAVHTGIVESVGSRGTFVAIEGNTTPEGGTGDQTNGGGVYRRNRHTSEVRGFWRVPLLPDSIPFAPTTWRFTDVPAPTDFVDRCPGPRPGTELVLTADGGIEYLGFAPGERCDCVILANTGQRYAFGAARGGAISYPALPEGARKGDRYFTRIRLG